MNLIIADDDNLITMSLTMILESSKDIHVLATANNGQDAVDLYKKHSPDIALLDIRMKPMNGIETAKAILHFDAQAKILFLTTFLDDEYIIDALNLGAKGYILKQEYETIIPALNAIMSGQNVFGSEIVSKIPNLMNSSNSDISYTQYDITDKEFEIIELIASGLSNKEIANELNLSEGTVRNYLSIILEKLSLRDRTQLAIFYYKHQL